MNLIKSFNAKFFKQNVKKSKGSIIFGVLLLPILTFLLLFIVSSSNDKPYALGWSELSIVNIVFMYIYPFVLSIILNGYFYKKNSTDFINSMPINRKTFFITNTIGGIGLILLSQALTVLVIFISKFIFPNNIIFGETLWDSFLIMLVSHIFIFTASNLAMTISSSKGVQFVATAIILFIVPFTVDCLQSTGTGWEVDDKIIITDGYAEAETYCENHINNYTMPYKVIRYFSYVDDIFSYATILKMAILSIIYIAIGLKLFEHKKMENDVGDSLSQSVYLAIKSLVIWPIMLFANVLISTDDYSLLGYDSGKIFVIVVLVAILIYYFVYDFITKRKVKFHISILNLIATIVIFQLIIMAFVNVLGSSEKEIKLENIKSVSIGSTEDFTSSRDSLYTGNNFVKNEELVQIIFENLKNEDSSKYRPYSLVANLKVGFDKTYSVYLSLTESEYNKIISIFENDESYFESMKKRIKSKGEFLIDGEKIDSDFASLIDGELSGIGKDKLKEWLKAEHKHGYYTSSDYGLYIEKIIYNSHHIIKYYIPIDFTDKIFKEFSNYENQKAKEILEARSKNQIANGYYTSLYIYDSDGDSDYIYDQQGKSDILEIVYDNMDKKFDSTKDYVAIKLKFYKNSSKNHYSNGSYIDVTFFTNEVDKINKIAEKYKDNYSIDENIYTD